MTKIICGLKLKLKQNSYAAVNWNWAQIKINWTTLNENKIISIFILQSNVTRYELQVLLHYQLLFAVLPSFRSSLLYPVSPKNVHLFIFE